MVLFGFGKKKASDEDVAAFIQAVRETGDLDKVRLLIDAGVPPDSKDANGDTALKCAFRNFDLEMAELLLYAGAELSDDSIVEAYSARGFLGGEIAGNERLDAFFAKHDSSKGNLSPNLYAEMVKFLVRKGADPDRPYLGLSLEQAVAGRLSASKKILDPAGRSRQLMKMLQGSGAFRRR